MEVSSNKLKSSGEVITSCESDFILPEILAL